MLKIEQHIAKYRTEIDKIDEQIILYLNKRKELSDKLISEKLNYGIQIFDSDREEQIINKLYHHPNNKLDLEFIRDIYAKIFFYSKFNI